MNLDPLLLGGVNQKGEKTNRNIFSGWISSFDNKNISTSDTADIYRFTVPKLSYVEVDIFSETIRISDEENVRQRSSATVELYRDTNNNGVLEAGEEAPVNLPAYPGNSNRLSFPGRSFSSTSGFSYNLQPGVTYFAYICRIESISSTFRN